MRTHSESIRILKCYLLSTYFYGGEVEASWKRIDAFGMYGYLTYYRMLRYPWKSRENRIRHKRKKQKDKDKCKVEDHQEA